MKLNSTFTQILLYVLGFIKKIQQINKIIIFMVNFGEEQIFYKFIQILSDNLIKINFQVIFQKV